jgi:hypothetical protein
MVPNHQPVVILMGMLTFSSGLNLVESKDFSSLSNLRIALNIRPFDAIWG